jgi:hypothetical protein
MEEREEKSSLVPGQKRIARPRCIFREDQVRCDRQKIVISYSDAAERDETSGRERAHPDCKHRRSEGQQPRQEQEHMIPIVP